MRILTSSQVREWDQFTIDHEPILSIDLMERAARTCTDWILQHYPSQKTFVVFCGKGNNGGDGLAIARMLTGHGIEVSVYILEFGHLGTVDFQSNLARLHELPLSPRFISSEELIPEIPNDPVVIDALLGTGLNRRVEGLTESVVHRINSSENEVISIDIPSGLSADKSSAGNTVIRATHTLAFQCLKPAFMVAENQQHTGEVHILDIGLHPQFEPAGDPYLLVNEALVRSIFKPRPSFSHKGTFGHALLCVGSYGKMGAGILAAKACLRAGVGLLSVHIPNCGYTIIQSAVPEAMAIADLNDHHLATAPPVDRYQAIGIGPGIDTDDDTKKMLQSIMSNTQPPVILDADALNILSKDRSLLKLIEGKSILTPHPKEFERLFGESTDDFSRLELLKAKAIEYNAIILLKGRYSCVASPEGKLYFNSSGNPGMATGGSGDVLTGMLTAFVAQGYQHLEATLLAMYLHGIAGDLAANKYSQEAMIAGDIIESIPEAFKALFYEIESAEEY